MEEKNRIKFYSISDLANGYQLELAEKKLQCFSSEPLSDINDAIELYNIKLFFDNGCFLTRWDDTVRQTFLDICKEISRQVAVFFSGINESNIESFLSAVDWDYLDDFWTMFASFGVYKRISDVAFERIIDNPNFIYWQVLCSSALVKQYDSILAKHMREDYCTAELLIDYYLADHSFGPKRECYFPNSLSDKDKEQIVYDYATSDSAGINYLYVLSVSQSVSNLSINDKLRLLCKKRYEEYWRNNKNAAYVESGVSIQFHEFDGKPVRCNFANNTFSIEYSTSFMDLFLDNEALFANFAWFFGFIDKKARCEFVSRPTEMGVLERTMGMHGNKEYRTSIAFNQKNQVFQHVLHFYQGFLKAHGKSIEHLLRWFFSEYLCDEFGIKGFVFNPPSDGTNYMEKCKLLSSSIDGILKQFRLYQEEGKIDRELYEISSSHIIVGTIPSLIAPKYAYAKSDDIKKRMYLLFSNQSTLSFTEKTHGKYRCLYDLLKNENLTISDFYPWQKQGIDWLVEKGDILVDDSGSLSLNPASSYILNQLYHHEVVCVQHEPKIIELLNSMEKAGDLEYSNTLFSKPEADYLNYVLNRSEFSNGLDLRNKYIHDTNSLKEEVFYNDYYLLLRILVLIALKIQDEFFLREEQMNATKNGFENIT